MLDEIAQRVENARRKGHRGAVLATEPTLHEVDPEITEFVEVRWRRSLRIHNFLETFIPILRTFRIVAAKSGHKKAGIISCEKPDKTRKRPPRQYQNKGPQ